MELEPDLDTLNTFVNLQEQGALSVYHISHISAVRQISLGLEAYTIRIDGKDLDVLESEYPRQTLVECLYDLGCVFG